MSTLEIMNLLCFLYLFFASSSVAVLKIEAKSPADNKHGKHGSVGFSIEHNSHSQSTHHTSSNGGHHRSHSTSSSSHNVAVYGASVVEANKAITKGDKPVFGKIVPRKPGKPKSGKRRKPSKPKPGKNVHGKHGKPGKPGKNVPGKHGKPGKPGKPKKPGKGSTSFQVSFQGMSTATAQSSTKANKAVDKPAPTVGNQPGDKPQTDGLPVPGLPLPDVPQGGGVPGGPQPDFPLVQNRGTWELILQNSGVSVMHLNLLPNNKIMFYDASAYHVSNIKLPNGQCVPYKKDDGTNAVDCDSHAVEYDIAKNTVRPLLLTTDAWCSSGGITPDGRFVSTGGWANGIRTYRYFTPCDDGRCEYKEYPNMLGAERWYATQINLADGRVFIAGGRQSYNYEYLPKEGERSVGPIFSELLDATTDIDENNLYPFVHQNSDGNIFIFANDQSVLFNPKTNRHVKKFPVLPGGARNYPASGMSALLPIELQENNPPVIPVEVIICGGAPKDAYAKSAPPNNRVFIPALSDCARMRINDPNPQWDKEEMPSRRVMGDMLNLPTGDLLIINGAKAGASAWWQAEDPNFVPVIYNPKFPKGNRFFEMAPSHIPRMYHSTSGVLPSTKIIVSGSNPNSGYWFAPDVKYKTELRVEIFNPPYLDKSLDIHRPSINAAATANKLKYGMEFQIQFRVNEADRPGKEDFKVHMYAVPFTTHGYSQNQRLLVLFKKDFKALGGGMFALTALAPPSGNVAPPGSYLLFVVHRNVPSEGVWVQMQL